ncbi:MAG: DUF1194 domain-containing protein [Aestuariivirgaceae bacterium]
MRVVSALALFLAVIAAWLPGSVTAAAEKVDLELVLAVDASGSVNAREFQLQLSGIARAFRDRSIQQAITSGAHGRIAVSLLVWSDAAFPVRSIGWHVLVSPQDAHDFANAVEGLPQREGGGTGIGNGVAFAIRAIAGNGIEGTRRIVDVSGDGPETPPWFGRGIEMPAARRLAEQQKVTINGLAILTDFPRLDEWYREHVMTGTDSFVMRAGDYEDFADAIREKLWREITVIVSDADQHLKRPKVMARSAHHQR